MTPIRIVSFGYLHGPPPAADLSADLRHAFRDPHVAPHLRDLTAHDQAVRDAVMATPGIRQLIVGLVAAADAYLDGPSATGITIALGCAGGRHRAAVTAEALCTVMLADRKKAADYGLTNVAAGRPPRPVHLTHRDLHRPVVHR
ncbi:RapZ C-terminal domain-containing protein [Streptomyces sp. WMMC1477]|uniref:RapZ C-terminal domain-containing protein n=1 Tax=Streptomyces sp. WMMC1477 TaxID=3015155 RepID=UPI0022B626D6|nr:RNase adapter RapZ [Streptomyces sp. WMMC1477]MCZ7430096.1 ATPase [Streptomyces sp. WMMC1477]